MVILFRVCTWPEKRSHLSCIRWETGGLVILIPRLSRAGLGGLERTRTWTWTVLATLSAIAEHVVLAVAVVRMDSA